MNKKIMLAIGHKIFEERLIELLKNKYDFTGTAPYREAIVTEALKYEPDIIIIRENLDGTANMTDIIYSLKNEVPSARIIFISTERQAGDEFLATLVSYGVYDLMVGTQIQINNLVELINNPSTFSKVSAYAAQVTVDEKGNKKVFETKIIQAPTPVQVENSPKQNKILPLLPTPNKKKETVIETIDEEIPLSFIKNNLLDEEPSRIRVDEDAKQNQNLKYNEKFYAPNDYMTKTSKPVKLPESTKMVNDVEVAKKVDNSPKVLIEDDFDFMIVDDQGNPLMTSEAPKVEIVKPVQAEEKPIEKPVIQEVTPEPLKVEEVKISEVKKVEEVKPIVVPVVEKKPVILKPEVKIEKPVVLKVEAPVQPLREPEVKPVPLKSVPVSEVKVEDEEDDFLSVKRLLNQAKPVVVEKTPVVEEKPSLVKSEENKPKVDVLPVFEGVKPLKKNKFLNGMPFSENTKVLFFMRTEALAENHTALNVAIKLAKDNKKVFFLEVSKDSSYDYFMQSLTSLQDNLNTRKMDGLSELTDIVNVVANKQMDYFVIDAHVDDELEPFMLMNGKRFLLIKQNKPWIQNAFKSTARLSMFAKFSMLVIEEYTESGISPKVIMNELQPFGVLRVKDKKETNFFSLNAKNPAMLTKKNHETLEAFKDLMDYIYDREAVINE